MQQENKRCFAGFEDRASLYKLWKEAFSDKAEYLDLLFHTGYLSDKDIHVIMAGEELASAVAVKRVLFGTRKSAEYLCYAATFRKFQGHGFMRALIKNITGTDGIYTLIPSNKSLFTYYKSLGFLPELRFYR